MNFINILYLFIKSFSKSLYGFIGKHFRYATLQSKYNKCKIAPTSIIDNSMLNEYVVVFDNVIVSNCNIGSHSYIQKNSRLFNSTIGNFCSIASNVSIAPGLHPTSGVSTHPSFFLKNTPLVVTFADRDFFDSAKKVTIGHDVWIGENVIILDGITIGTGAIIAAGSVVTKDVEPYSIMGGVPAKIIKYRFSDDIILELLKSEWWNIPNSWFVSNFKSMHNISDFLLQNKNKGL